ncbi:MAG: hypothetical protein KJ770_06175 [Actinobacteria bacterium]|nr:hypothetical protein [Actinomycetota bacterium]
MVVKKFPTGAWGKIFAKVRNFHLQKTPFGTVSEGFNRNFCVKKGSTSRVILQVNYQSLNALELLVFVQFLDLYKYHVLIHFSKIYNLLYLIVSAIHYVSY